MTCDTWMWSWPWSLEPNFCAWHTFFTLADFLWNLIKFASAILSYCGYTNCKGNDLWLVIVTLNLGNGNQNFVCDTPSYFGLPFSKIWSNLLSPFWVIVDTWFVRDEPITYDPDHDRQNLNFVLDTPSHYALPLCEIWLGSQQLFLSDHGHTILKWQTFDLGLWPWSWSWEPKYGAQHTFSCCLTFLWSLMKFPLLLFELWLTHDL